jgi:hypothetical protein
VSRISVKSAKAKGRNLQNLVAKRILEKYTALDANDVKGCPMGSSGMDLQLSNPARELFPYAVECKARAAFSLYTIWDQAAANCEGLEPLLILKGDRKQPLVVMDLDKFMELI